MHKLFEGLMLLLCILIGIFIIALIINHISWKIYTLIYTDYTWGLFFPYAKYRSVVAFVVIALLLLIISIIAIFIRLRNRFK